MRNAWLVGVSCGAWVLASGAMLAAPGQDRPGQPTQARVWVQNRGLNEAVPISVHDVDPKVLMKVQIVGTAAVTAQIAGTPAVSLAQGTIVPTRAANQQWDYRTITITTGTDPAATLRNAGSEGWETTGLQFPSQTGAQILLKRPR